MNLSQYDPILMQYIETHTDNHNHLTRNVSKITLPRFNCEKTKRSIKFKGCKYWNDLPAVIKDSPSQVQFKNKLRAHIGTNKRLIELYFLNS